MPRQYNQTRVVLTGDAAALSRIKAYSKECETPVAELLRRAVALEIAFSAMVTPPGALRPWSGTPVQPESTDPPTSFAFFIGPHLLARMDRLVDKRGTTVDEFIRIAIHRYLNLEEHATVLLTGDRYPMHVDDPNLQPSLPGLVDASA